MKFLSRIFKRKPFSNEKWSETLSRIVKAEDAQNLKLPMIFFDNEIEWEFEVFNSLEDLVGNSIYSHWGGLIPNGNDQIDAMVIDANGMIFTIDNNCYNKELKIGYSYPRKLEGQISLKELKEKISLGAKEYIECFDPNSKIEILNGIELVNKSTTIIEVIDSVNSNLDFYKLK